MEFLSLKDFLMLHEVEPSAMDVWYWHGSDKFYTPKRFYIQMHFNLPFNPLLNWIWSSSCTMKIKVFAWMMIMDRLNTKDMVERRHWHIEDGTTCVLCHLQVREDMDHLFFNCLFSQRVCNFLQIDWSQGNTMTEIVVNARRDFNKPFFAEVVFTACWNIWLIRNAKVVTHIRPSFNHWRRTFVHDMSLLSFRIKPRFKDSLVRWVTSLPP